MNIKSLLLGSAAALVAVSGARAADAVEVVAEPEPMEYVRVCDTYGTGYFYIPGTETCLRIGGYVRYDMSVGDGPYGGHTVTDKTDGSENDTYHKRARLSLRTWTGTETEMGTLSTYTETRFQYTDQVGTQTSLNFAWIQLGGFRVGKDESAFTTFPGYAGGVIADDLVPYGPFDTNLVSYTFDAGNGFSAIVSLETGEAGSDYEIDSYMPHVVGGAKYAGGWGAITGVVGYDSVYEEWAAKARLDVNVNDALSLFVMAGYGTDDDWVYSNYKPWNGNWAVWAGGSYKFSEKATFNIQGDYAEGLDGFDGDWGVAANVDYEIVKGLHIIPEVTYTDYGTIDNDAPGAEGFGGFLRFQRNF
ncbi:MULTISPECIES: porin [Mesorhizobium]|uniref:Porin n=1 Tax=Mesorhizobium denitrificans TaxID=2294114 RepID=A0A371XIW3_9HYPH|nr:MULTISPECIES: porin [Mesorhizobium]RFC69149.1 porin [Mesorhizobium denitrificans]